MFVALSYSLSDAEAPDQLILRKVLLGQRGCTLGPKTGETAAS
jgi:hypothetical protein